MSSPIARLRTFNLAALVAVHFAREHQAWLARVVAIQERLAALADDIETAQDAGSWGWLEALETDRLVLERELRELMPSSRTADGALKGCA